jgi:hypothetical protein
MLLSMYLSYHWARTVKLRSYLTRITLPILGTSFLSIVFTFNIVTIVFFPLLLLTSLSWPAIFSWHWGRSYGAETLRYINVYGINFFTIHITTHNTYEYFLFAFLLSCFVNILGALFGYLIGKKLEIHLFHHKLWNSFWGLVGIGCIVLGVGISFFLMGFGILLLETIIVSRLLGPFPWIITSRKMK